ncbi:benzoate-coenzyme A ligase [Actibacterium atlanticum]|uniref:Benzoate-coenzyme A ligase n=1 Tax=Actibacterium atlanticum TaxID=1461693 RepID=A0A058ZRC8_9RHOB|nr:class I adenylate-forming enzyme family protein [Actibacterium atlanticum]KCV83702.1 benzoate-coenzyme A ligase [Actibacterium atlanticum]
MLSIYDETLPKPCPAPFNLAQYVLQHAAGQPDKIALEVVSPTRAQRWTYAQLEKAVLGVAGGFRAMGLPAGARVLLRLGNTVDFPIAFLGAIAAGLLPVPTAAQLTAEEITKLADQVDPALVIAGKGIALPDHCAPVLDAKALEALFEHAPGEYVMGDPNRPAYMIFTSGTSGRPRGVLHAHRAIWARRMMWNGWYDLKPDDRLLHAGAFNWTYTLGTGLMDPWAIGATALIPESGVDATALPELLTQFKATIFAAAPGVYRQVLKQDANLTLPTLRHGLSAGEKMPAAVRAAWNNATGTRVYEALGMSECSTYLSGSPAKPAPDQSSGYPQPGRRLAVLGADMQPVTRGEPGQMAISNRDPGLMLGYWRAEGETREKFAGEWFLTGDMVEMAADGAVTYLGRNDDMMNAGGFRVSPIEVETALTAHPQITEVAATEVQVKADTTVIAAFYTGDVIDEAALKAYAVDHLARYKQPRIYVHMESLPKGGNGKLNRRALREGWEADHDQT